MQYLLSEGTLCKPEVTLQYLRGSAQLNVEYSHHKIHIQNPTVSKNCGGMKLSPPPVPFNRVSVCLGMFCQRNPTSQSFQFDLIPHLFGKHGQLTCYNKYSKWKMSKIFLLAIEIMSVLYGW